MKIQINALSQKSWKNAMKEVKQYRRELFYKNREFLSRLAQEGITVIKDNLNPPGDSEDAHLATEKPYIKASGADGRMKLSLRIRGKDVAFIEFGAGIHYNGTAGSSPHPLGAQFGYTIGSYGMGQGKEDHWWYKDANGITVISYGTEASMPLYKADIEIRNKFLNIAKEVFRS